MTGNFENFLVLDELNKALEHLQLFGKMTCYHCLFGKRRKILL